MFWGTYERRGIQEHRERPVVDVLGDSAQPDDVEQDLVGIRRQGCEDEGVAVMRVGCDEPDAPLLVPDRTHRQVR